MVLETPDRFFAIGQWYGDFTQTPDSEVTDLLDRAADTLTDGGWRLSAGGDCFVATVSAFVVAPRGPSGTQFLGVVGVVR